MPHVRHVCVLLPLVRPHVRHVRLDLHIAVSLKGRTTRIWSFGCAFAYATAMGCDGLECYLVQLLFNNYTLMLNKDQEIKVFQHGLMEDQWCELLGTIELALNSII